MEVCKWLFDHGAARDVKRRCSNEYHFLWPGRSRALAARSPLCAAFLGDFAENQSLSKWFIMNGALCKDDGSGDLDFEKMQVELFMHFPILPLKEGRKALLEWATDLHGARTSFLLFLSGALPPPHHTGIRKLLDMMRCACSIGQVVQPLHLLVGKPGVLELVGDYVGVVRGREARIIRQLTEMLPRTFADDYLANIRSA